MRQTSKGASDTQSQKTISKRIFSISTRSGQSRSNPTPKSAQPYIDVIPFFSQTTKYPPFLSDWKSTPIYYESKWFNLFTSPTGGQASYTPSQLSILVFLASPLYFAQYRHAALYFDFENVHTTTGTILLTQEPRIKSTTQIQKRKMISSPR